MQVFRIQNVGLLIWLIAASIRSVVSAEADPSSSETSHRGPGCLIVDRYFADEVWTKIGEQSCLKCHNAKGDASESNFLLRESAFDQHGQDLYE